MSIIHPIEVVRAGDTWEFTGPIYENDGVTPLPLTGASITWKVDSLDGKTNYITATIGSGITVDSLTTSTIQYQASTTQTAPIVPGTYYDTVSVTLSSGNGGGTFTVIEGYINVLAAEA